MPRREQQGDVETVTAAGLHDRIFGPEGAENSSAPSDQHLRAFVAELQTGIHRR
jgi:hypothetical protein